MRPPASCRFRSLPVALLLAALSIFATACGEQKPTDSLPHLKARIDRTSVSGISSGAYMAGQFQMAHAKIVIGAAIIAGGPYGCSESVFADAMPGPGSAFINLTKAINGCMLNTLGLWGAADPTDLAIKARRRADRGEIDPIADVARDRIYLFSGRADMTVVEPVVAAAADFYRQLGVPADNIKFVTDIPAGHAFVTDDEGSACGVSGEPYLVNCHYDQAGELLRHILGTLSPRAETPSGDFFEFDQRPFVKDFSGHGLANHGIVFIPATCRTEPGCSIHVAYHGCSQNRERVGEAFVRASGLARWADTNKLIVLFPQTATTAFNPQGCWDWWGYTGHNYLSRDAMQIVAVRRMIDELSMP